MTAAPASATIVIERDVPIPPARRALRDEVTHALTTMAITESFVVPVTIKNPHQRVSTANARLKPKKFMGRNRDGEFRIWRIA